MTAHGSILFVDAYDSFAENIAALLRQQLHVDVTLISIHDNIAGRFHRPCDDFFRNFDAIVLGPGPGNPKNESDVGNFGLVWEYAAREGVPVLGICLGFQSLCARYGAPVVRMDLPCHGHAKEVCHVNKDIFLDSGLVVATNYNSLGVHTKDLNAGANLSRSSSSGSLDSHSSSLSAHSASSTSSRLRRGRSPSRMNDNLEALAWDRDGWLMAVKHTLYPFHGLQFHPESCKSNAACRAVIQRWWESAVTHNRLCRPVRPDVEGSRGSSPPALGPSDASLLQAKLSELGNSCASTAAWARLSTSATPEMIADLCHNMSPPYTVAMLESTKRGRYSIYAFPDASNVGIEYASGICRLIQAGVEVFRAKLDRAQLVRALQDFVCDKQNVVSCRDVPFLGGFMGFLSYEFGTESLDLDVPSRRAPPPLTPDLSLLWVDRSMIFDHDTGRAEVQSIRADDDLWVDGMIEKVRDIASSTPSHRQNGHQLRQMLCSTTAKLPDHDDYVAKIQACQSELLAGNSYELCLTTEATVTTPMAPGDSWLLYKNIQKHNPVPFAAYVRLNKTSILSSSPEQFLSWSPTGTIDMVPMKGTVKKTPDMTRARATEILASAKESAENLMIADLIRHDLQHTVGRDARVETVKLCHVVETETVFSLVSHLRAWVPLPGGVVRESTAFRKEVSKHGLKALSRTLPPGSMTGAPKKRSCEILHRLEQRDRGVYSGAIGYIDVGGHGAWNVCIRSAFSNDDEIEVDEQTGAARRLWRIGAGGAITVLSDDEQEWEEMMAKLDSVMQGFRVP